MRKAGFFLTIRGKIMISIVMMVSLCLIAGWAISESFDCTANNVEWTCNIISGEQNVSIVPKDKSKISGDITIPGTVSYNDTSYTVKEIGMDAFNRCSELTNVTIPDSVTKIGHFAFYSCTGLTSIIIPENVSTISGEAFRNCTGLLSVTISRNASYIGDDAFDRCISLTEFITDSNCKNFSTENGVLYNKDKTLLKRYPMGKTDSSFSIPSSVKSIAYHAFQFCQNLTSVSIPESVTQMGDGCFYWCTNLETVNIPEKITIIGESTFYCCPKLGNVTLPSGLTKIEDSAFYNCAMTSLTIPKSVKTIGGYAFYGCENLSSIVFESGIQLESNVWDHTFDTCKNLSSITIPYGVTSLRYTFNSCTNINNIIIPGSVETFRDVFYACSSLMDIYLPENFDLHKFDRDTTYTSSSYLDVNEDGISYTITGASSNVSGTFHFYSTVATPAFSQAGGEYDTDQTITLSCATEDAKIYYTTDGTNPSVTDSEYTEAITVNETTTIKAIAVKGGLADSVIATATYTLPTAWKRLQNQLAAGGDITLNKDYTDSGNEGALVVPSGKTVNLDLNGHVINRGLKSSSAQANGNVITVYGTLNVTDGNSGATHDPVALWPYDVTETITTGGVIAGGRNSSDGGGVRVENGGAFTLAGGCIAGNSAGNYSSGGGVYLSSSGGTFTMTGGSICGNIAQNGAGVCMDGNSNNGSTVSFRMTGGTITGNVATYGGGVYASKTFEMNGGSINGNTATYNSAGGGGVYISGSGSMKLSGNSTVSGNKNSRDANAAASNVCLYNGKTIIMTGALDSNARIGITTKASPASAPVTVTSNWTEKMSTADPSVNFSSDNTSYAIICTGDEAALAKGPYNVSVTTEPSDVGTVSFDRALPRYYNGETVTLTVTTESGYQLDSLTTSPEVTISGTDQTRTFTMSNQDMIVTAAFSEISVTAPTIGTQPQDLSLTYGYTEGSISVAATAAEGHTLGYQWYSNTTNNNTTGSAIQGAKSASYDIPTGYAAGTTKYYYCAVTAARTDNGQTATATSNVAAVTVGKATAQTPAGVSVSQAYSVTSVSASVAGKMPADAGTLTYTAGTATKTGSVNVSNFAVSNDGAVTATLSGGAKGDTITLPVTIFSDNYADSTINVVVTLTDNIIDSGDCGNSVSWTLDDEGLLSIFGSGAMADYSANNDEHAPWYEYRESITAAKIGAGVTTIGGRAFYKCSNLVSIDLPNGLTTIGVEAFYNCTGLEEISIPDGVEGIYTSAFDGCSSLESLVIPESVKGIGDDAFSNCSKLSTIDLPQTCPVYFGVSLFSGCTELKSVALPDGIASIGQNLFSRCSSLKEVIIPDSVTQIEDEAFSECTSLEEIDLPDGITDIGAGVFSGCTSLKSITIPKDVKSIGGSAFSCCSSLETIYFPDDINSFGTYVFYSCNSICYANMNSKTAYALGEKGYSFRTSDIHYNLRYLYSNGVFYGLEVTGVDSDVKVLNIQEGVTSIRNDAFSVDNQLEKIILPDGIKTIGEMTFYGCRNLLSINLPNSIETIKEAAFANCTKLSDVYYGGTVEDREKITIEESNTPLGNAEWHYPLGSGSCGTNAKWILYEGGHLKIYGTGAMEDYYSSATVPWQANQVKTVSVESGITHIGDNSFNGCSQLTSVVMADSITSIGHYAFYECTSLSSIMIPDEVTSIGASAFYHGPAIRYAKKDKKSAKALGDAGYTFRETGSNYSLIYLITGLDTYTLEIRDVDGDATVITIPEDVTSIGERAFQLCRSLISVSIPDGVKTIKDKAFYYCDKLTQISLPSSLTSIGEEAFYSCDGLTGITIPDHVVKIDDYAFYACDHLQNVILSQSLTQIGDHAFGNCVKLKEITIPASVESIGIEAFMNCFELKKMVFLVEDTNKDVSISTLMFRKDYEPVIYCYLYTAPDVWASGNKYEVRYLDQSVVEEIRTITIPESLKIACGHSQKIEAFVFPETGDQIVWGIEPEGIATLSAGTITGIAPGTATVTATIGTTSASMEVECYIPATAISISTQETWLQAKDSIHLSVAATAPENAVIQSCLWESSDTDLAFITEDETGVMIKTIKPGDVTITATTEMNVSAECTIHLTYPVSTVSLTGSENHTMNVGDTLSLTATVTTSNEEIYTNKLVSYASSDESVATVDANGTVTALAGGHTTITAYTSNEKEDQIELCVICNEHTPESIPAVQATCEEPGLTEGSRCSVCGTILAAQTDTDPLGHDWNDPEYVWSEDYSAVTGSRICKRDDNHEEHETVQAASAVTLEPTCSAKGTITYTSAEFQNQAFTQQTLPVSTEMNPDQHSWGSPAYIWAEDNSEVTAKIICEYNAAHIRAEETVETKVTVTKEPSCTETGLATYKAVFTNTLFTTQTKEDVVLPTIDHTPAAAVEENTVNPTCTETGSYDSVIYCSECGTKISSTPVTTSALGHDYGPDGFKYDWAADHSTVTASGTCIRNSCNHQETEEANVTSEVKKPATCEENGTTAYTAKFTNPLFETQVKTLDDIPALNHDWSVVQYEWAEDNKTLTAKLLCKNDSSHENGTETVNVSSNITRQPTCTEAGETTYTSEAFTTNALFTVQTKKLQDVNATGHNLTKHDKVSETCTTDGSTEYWYCSSCQNYFSDKDATKEIPQANTVIPAGHKLQNHAEIASTCSKAGTKAYWSCTVCGALFADGDGKTAIEKPIEIPKKDHTIVTDAAVAATCTKTGLTEGKHCSVCNQVLVAQQNIPAKGHTEVVDAGKAATCTETGLTEGKHCSVCNQVLVAQQVIPAKGHTEAVDAGKAATCTETGLTEGKHCSVCNQVLVAQQNIPAKGHTEVTDAAVPATEKSTGLTEGKHCSVCGKVLVAQEVTPMLPPADPIEAFVSRCYRLILGREPDQSGLEYWKGRLSSGEATAAEIINGFVNSDEFRNKNLSYGDQVEVLYQVMLDRGSDEAGKAYWVSMLSSGNPLAVVINGFCGSTEFTGICAEFGITPGSVNADPNNAAPAPAPAPAPAADMTKIRAFVTRNYRVILGREPDADGLNYWAQRLASGEAAAAEIINGFVNSDEFRNKNLSYGDQVEVLYQVMLDRGSDEAGKSYWVSMLSGGNPLAAIINGFCNSDEFKGICADYGITPGSVEVSELKPPQEVRVVDTNKIKGYITRCYRVILSREPDQGGLDYWTGKMASGELEAAAIIDQFVNSIEFTNKQLSNRDAVEVLYQAMLGRGSDEAGMGYWIARLEAGEPFAVIINGFCNSQEFKGICAEYGITPGSVAVASVTTYANPEEEEETPEQTPEQVPEQEPEQILEQTPKQTPEQPLASKSTPADERTEKAKSFVTHCYQSALLREPNTEEIDYYTEKILSGQMTARDIMRAFAFSQEFQGKWTDSTAFVRVLYRLCLDREADSDGLVYWTEKLANGETAAAVFNALTENKEFVQVCATYGVPAGVDANAIRAQEEAAAAAEANEAPAAPASEFTNEEKIRAFVSRFYRDAMGREADEEGLNYYTSRILNGEATPKDVAREIILSEEFRSRMPGNEELVRILYRVYLGREADEEGLANWAGQLESGVTLETILNGFAGSEEFAAVVNGLK